VRGLPSTFRWLLAGAFLTALASFVLPFLALFLASRGFSPSQAGLLAGLFGTGAAISGPIYGTLADRVGRRPVLAGTLLLAAGLTAAVPFVEGWVALAAITLALGLTANGYRPAAAAVVADVVPPEAQLRAFGLMDWAQNVGVGLSFLAGGALASRGFTLPFLLDAATTAAFAVVVLARVPETRPASAAAPGGPGLAAVLGDGPYLRLMLLTLAIIIPFGQFTVAVPLAMAAQGHDTVTFGAVMAVNCGLIALFQLPALRLVAGWEPVRVQAGAAVLIGLGTGAYALAGPAWSWALATAIWTCGEIMLFPTVKQLVAALAPEALRGRYQGGLGVAFGGGFALAPVVGGAGLEALGPRLLFGGCLAAGLLVAAGHLLTGPALRRALAARRG